MFSSSPSNNTLYLISFGNFGHSSMFKMSFSFNSGVIVALKATVFALCDETNNVSFVKFLSMYTTPKELFNFFFLQVKSLLQSKHEIGNAAVI